MSKLLLSLVVASSLFGACTAQRDVEYAGQVKITSPDLVAMEPGSDVQVVADSEDPIFYNANAYWMWRNNRWYRADDLHRGWVHVATPPQHIRNIDRPLAYAHFRVHSNEARNQHR